MNALLPAVMRGLRNIAFFQGYSAGSRSYMGHPLIAESTKRAKGILYISISNTLTINIR